MKTLFTLIIFLLLVQLAFAELTPEDIKIISDIVKEENAATEKRLREYVDLKFEILDTKFTTKLSELDTKFTTKLNELDTKFTTKLNELDTKFTTNFESVDKRQTLILILVTSLVGLIVLAIGIPQIIIALKQRDQGVLETEIKTLREKVELLEQTRLMEPH